MTHILAQANIDQVPNDIFKWVIVILLGLLLVAAIVWGAFRSGGRQSVKIDQEPPPEFRKATKRYNHDLAEDRHRETSGKLDDHERRLREIENSRVRNEQRFNKIWIVLTRIATKMDVRVPGQHEEEEA